MLCDTLPHSHKRILILSPSSEGMIAKSSIHGREHYTFKTLDEQQNAHIVRDAEYRKSSELKVLVQGILRRTPRKYNVCIRNLNLYDDDDRKNFGLPRITAPLRAQTQPRNKLIFKKVSLTG